MGSQATARLALASSVRERWRVPPLLALVLVAAVGLLVTGRPWPRPGQGPWLDRPPAAAWTPGLPALLTLAAVAIVSGPVTGARRSVARAASLAAALETALGALAMTLGLAIYHPHLPAGGVALGWFSWLALALGSGALVGMLFLSLTRLRPEPEHLAPALLAALLFGAGVGYAADLTPFVVCALAAVLIANLSPQRRGLRNLQTAPLGG